MIETVPSGAISGSADLKPLLIFVNPHSGTKIAKKLFKKQLKPKLHTNNIPYELIITEYAGHAKEIVQNRDLTNYGGIVTISGDGLMFEVLNGLYRLPSWTHQLEQIPIGIVPGGSGNALNCSLLRQLDQPLDGVNNLGAASSALNVALGARDRRTTPLDFIEVQTHDGKRVLSFLGVTIGLIADCDIGSEFARFMGYWRTYYLVAARILFPRAYVCKVSYIPLPRDDKGQPVPVPRDAPPLQMPDIGQPLSSGGGGGWVTETGRYFVVYAINLPLLDPATLLSPDSRTNDGVIWLVMVRDTMPRKEMIQWFLDTENAGHIGKTGVELVPVRAFRIEPIRPRGYLSIDAESFKFGPVQGQILPGKAKLLTQ